MKKLQFILITLILISCSSDYELRDKKVYYVFFSFGNGGWNEKVIENADINSFVKIDSDENLFGKDNKNVYFNNEIIPGADPKTFKHIKNGYAIDKKRAYYYNDSIANSSSKEFKIIDGYFSKDYKDVYYTTMPLKVCSLKNFKFVFNDNENNWERWSTDGCFYYFNNFKVPSKDYKNITIFKGSAGISKDRKSVYIKDRNIYYNEQGKRILDTIDIKTFTVENDIYCKDKFGCINIYHGREGCYW